MTSRNTLRQTLQLAAGVALLTGLSGCVLLEGPPITTPERTVVERPQTTVMPEELVLSPDGTAEENRDFFVATLYDIAETDENLSSHVIAHHFLDAGFVREQLQVSIDTTPTGLVADSMYVSARFEQSCILGQVDTASRQVFVSIEATVGPNADLCLIGQTAPLD